MKKLLALLLSVVMCFSLTACGGGNAIPFRLDEVRIMSEAMGDEYISYSAKQDQFDLEVNLEKNSLTFTSNGKQFKGKLTESQVNDGFISYKIDWSKTPDLMDDFVVDTKSDDKVSMLMIDDNHLAPAMVIPAGFDYEGRFVEISMWFWFAAE